MMNISVNFWKTILIGVILIGNNLLLGCKPTVFINASVENGKPPLEVKFDGFKTKDLGNDIIRYEWDFTNDGSIDSTGIETSHIYDIPGKYSARLVVTDSKGNSSEAKKIITVEPYARPQAVIEMSQQRGEAPLEVVFDGSFSTDEDNDIVTYNWDFDNDGEFEIVGSIKPVKIFESPGEYTVRLLVIDAQGLSSETAATVDATVHKEFQAVIKATPDAGESPLRVEFDGSSSTDNGYDPISSYDWDFDNDGIIDVSNSVTTAHTYDKPGKYTAKLIITDSKGNKAEAVQVIRSYGKERGYIPLYMPGDDFPYKHYLAIFDSSSQSLIETIELPVSASGYAAHPSGKKLYFSHWEDTGEELVTFIDIFDTYTRTIIQSINVGSIGSVNSLAVSPNGKKLYIGTHFGLYSLKLSDNSFNVVLSGGAFYKMAFSRDGGTRLYIVHSFPHGSQYITEIDTSNDRFTREHYVSGYIYGIECYNVGASPNFAQFNDFQPYVYLLTHDSFPAPQQNEQTNYITWVETEFAGNYLSNYVKELLPADGYFNYLASNWNGTRLYTAEQSSENTSSILNIIKIDTADRIMENLMLCDIVTKGGFEYLSGFGVPISDTRLFILSQTNIDPEWDEGDPIITCLSTDTLLLDETIVLPYHLDYGVNNFMVYSLNKISGRILSGGIPLAGYPVVISDGKVTKTSYTDEDGYYTFYMPDGSYDLKFLNDDSLCSVDEMPLNVNGQDIDIPDVAELLHLVCSVSDDVIYRGESTTLSWTTRQAESVKITPSLGQDIGSVDVNGSLDVSPLKKTTYSIQARGNGRSLTKELRVSVLYVAKILEFNSDRTTVYEGESVTLNWVIEDAEEIYLNGEEICDSIGSITVTPGQTESSYTIRARGTTGDYIIRTITISVVPQVVYYHYDILGNTIAQTDDQGRVIMKADFLPYGAAEQDLTGRGTPETRLYTGKERDETGLDYFGARYYDSSLGRFLSVDPAGPDPMNPMSWNRYAYCLNNPYKYVDPDGQWARNVHKTLTIQWAQAVHFTPHEASIIGKACIGVDSIWRGKSFIPLIGEQSYHFNTGGGEWNSKEDTRRIHTEEHLQKAIQLASMDYYRALKELGIGLHALQDIFAHDEEMGLQKEILDVYYHDQPVLDLKKNRADDITDVPTQGKERLIMTENATSIYLNRFLDATSIGGE